MRKLIVKLLSGKENKFSGLLAFALVGMVALGCTCGKNFDLANIAKNAENAANTSSANSSSTPPPFGDNTDTNSTATTTYTGKKADASKSEIPGDEELQSMVKTALLDFNDAVLSDDFTDFHSKICKPWQKQMTPESFRTEFKEFVDKRIDIKDIKPLDAQFSPDPLIAKVVGYRTLIIEGKYLTRPVIRKFILNYIPEGKEWKLSKIEVDTTEKY